MKEVKSRRGSKQIIIIIVMMMLCNFIVPNYAYAADTDDGGELFDPVIKFVTFLCDSVMQFMQNSFTSNASIDNGDGTYNFQYSPAIIFSGTVQGLDINFITPNTDERNTNNYEAFFRAKKTEYTEAAAWGSNNKTLYGDIGVENYNKYLELEKKVTETDKNKYKGILLEKTSVFRKMVYYYEENSVLYVVFLYFNDYGNDILSGHYETNYQITSEFLNDLNTTVTYNSIANELQPTIATWYNALRRIALVGLLSVLVYLGIRIVLSSSSPEGNSKYKKMLTDWLIALCLLFTLHYIMSATLVITQKLSSIFTLGTTDELLNTLRQEIDVSRSWGTALAQVIMYVVLVIYTGVFTFQYLKRVLYMAFFTMIAPLITLTYPIDKVSDGKAQAFSMWIKEYIFNALIQIVHLIVYFTLVESAMELVKTFPLYGIIAIGFMTQGEKIIRSMFGFNNAETVGTMGAVAAGGLITSAMNKFKSLPNGAKGGKSEGKSSSGGSSSGNVRTATNNPLSGVQGKSGTSASGGTSQNTTPGNSGTNRSIAGGAKSLVGKYGKPVAGTALGVLTGGAGAMIGFAAGVAQGDVGAALTGAAVGGTAGMNLGKGAVNLPGNIENGVKNGWNNLKDTYREGAYGAEAAGAIKFDEEFRKGSTYKALQSNPNFSEDSVQAMLDAGITDKKEMTAILDSGIDVNDAIKYNTVVKNCPNEIYYNDDMLRTFWKTTMGIDEKNAERIRDVLGQFK